MSESNISIYREHETAGRYNQAQKFGKKRFSTYLFHLAGSKFLLHKLIQLPILAQCNDRKGGAAQPASLTKCIKDLEEHKKSPEYLAAVERSQQRGDEHRRLSKQIWHETQKLAKAAKLSQQAKDGHYRDLDAAERKIVEDYDCGRLSRSLRQLLSFKTTTYKGIGASVQSS